MIGLLMEDLAANDLRIPVVKTVTDCASTWKLNYLFIDNLNVSHPILNVNI